MNDDIGQMIRNMALEMAKGQANAVRVGCEITEQRYGRSIKALRGAYEAACLNPEAKLPTVLSASILALLALHEQDTVNIYANAKTEQDKRPQWERDLATGAREPDYRTG